MSGDSTSWEGWSHARFVEGVPAGVAGAGGADGRRDQREGDLRTTIADAAAARPADLVSRQFAPPAPNRLWVADLTYVSTWSGFAYVAFVIDAYARRILGWRVAATMVLDSIEQAIWTRTREGVLDLNDVVHHSDRGSQGGFNRLSQHRLAGASSSWSLKASAGVFQPRVLRGLVLRA